MGRSSTPLPNLACGLAARRLAAAVLACGLLVACGGGGNAAQADVAAPTDLALLFMGNSHTATHDVPGTVAALLRSVRPGQTVLAVRAPASQFLEDHAQDSTTLGLLRQRPWRAVVMQAQKYSSSGLFDYPAAPAENLALEARQRGAVPLLFPEWPRRGIDETQRIFELHQSIARRQPACVAPVGQAWDAAALQWPTLPRHDDDGNHANASGAFLAALVLASSLSGVAPTDFPNLPGLPVDDATQARLRSAAAAAVVAAPPRTLCPGDPLL
jgi:hypothetical protein